jgi:hypothetical protein
MLRSTSGICSGPIRITLSQASQAAASTNGVSRKAAWISTAPEGSPGRKNAHLMFCSARSSQALLVHGCASLAMAGVEERRFELSPEGASVDFNGTIWRAARR